MNDPTPQPSHPAPDDWKPLSGLALTSFVLSLVFVFIGVAGPWFLLLIPLLMAAYALYRFDGEKQRGRRLALWAVGISFLGAGFTYAMHQSARVHFTRMGESVMTALASDVSDEEKDRALGPWTWAPALEAEPDLHAEWRARFAKAVEEKGAWTGEMQSLGLFKGVFGFFFPPDGVKEIGSGEAPPSGWAPGAVLWFPTTFERGTVYLALVMHEGDAKALQAAQDELKGTDPVPSFGDVRFYSGGS